MLDTLGYEDFSAQLNTNFRLEEVETTLELIEANRIKSAPNQEAFSLVFLGTKDFVLPQQTYTMTHENLGAGMIFLVPIEQSEAGTKYEALFNRIIETNS